jgi:hypothetical protein
LAIAGALLVTVAGAGAYELPLTLRLLTEAITLGQASDPVRRVFHQPYRLLVSVPPVDYIDIVTPFRRVEITAETERINRGRILSQREALAVADQASQGIEVWVEFTFHPLNNFIGVPDYDVVLAPPGAGDRVIQPRDAARVPRFGPRVDGLPLPLGATRIPQGSEPLTGGTIIATYDARLLDARGTYEVVVRDKGSTLAKARVDLSKLR